MHHHRHQQLLQPQQVPGTVVNVVRVTDLNGNEIVRVHYGQHVAQGVQVVDNGELAPVRQVPPPGRAGENVIVNTAVSTYHDDASQHDVC